MKNKFIRPLLFSASLLVTGWSIYFFQPAYHLNYSDWHLELESLTTKSKISAALNDPDYWESFSRWKCFKNKTPSFRCALADGTYPIPEILVDDGTKEYVFGLEYAENYDCDSVFKAWKQTLNSSKSFCFFGAFLPTGHGLAEKKDPNPTYLISRLKGRAYWDLEDIEFQTP